MMASNDDWIETTDDYDDFELVKWITPGQTREGIYLSNERCGDNNSLMYKFQENGAGTGWKSWGTTILDKRMSQIETGYWVRITYLGPKGKTKRFSVVYKPVEVAG